MLACYYLSFGLLIYLFSGKPEALFMNHPNFDDQRLIPILQKVKSQERLSFEDGVTLYRTADILKDGNKSLVVEIGVVHEWCLRLAGKRIYQQPKR